MKKYLLYIFILFSCNSRDDSNIIVIDNELPLAKILKSKIKQEFTIREQNRKLLSKDSTIICKDKDIDMLLKDVDKYQGNEMELIKLSYSFDAIHNHYQHNFDSLIQVNKSLRTSQIETFDALMQEKKKIKSINKQLEDASKLKIAKVEIKSYGFQKKKKYSLKKLSIKDTLIYFETDKAFLVKQVIISFVIPANTLISGMAHIKAIIHGNNADKGVTESKSFSLNGKEQDVSIPFNGNIDWRVAEHSVEIFNENELLWNGILMLK